MTIGVVIVTFRCRELALAALRSLEARTPALLPTTVVVDNASFDGTIEAVRAAFPAVTVIEHRRNLGFAAAVNRGIEALPSADVVCLLNPDAELLDDGIFAAADYLEAHPDVGVLGGRILNPDGSIQPSARAFPSHKNALFNRHSLLTKLFPRNRWSRQYLMTDWSHDDIRPVDWVSGAFMLIHRRALEAVGPFDPGYFFSIEDVDFCRRVHDAGLRVEYFPGASVRHRVGGSSRKAVYRAMAGHHRGMWRYYRKHFRGNPLLHAVTAAGIGLRFALHAVSYALRAGRARLLGRETP
ncbi:glycosyltransferase family 2 protein [Tepidiforma flava]|uniref:Glycosyltransferase family 2 protein n=1 Tax=Tepidiforma flava TaxID=3004094 RepID=A0ABY7M533_9CHLR|nr:glycosyltransferase family 2 protein [Tepidiforma flava]WBL35110.1 glycosyltransferase family 2 protein [Tepidiforma flava]